METAIVSMLIGLGLQVVAEHVGTAPALDVLRAMGVGKVQGFLTGGPQDLQQVLDAGRSAGWGRALAGSGPPCSRSARHR